MPLGERAKLRAQELGGNVDSDVLRRAERREQALGLRAVAGAEVDQCATGSDDRGDLASAALEDRALVTRQRVLRQRTDRFEQPRAEFVVEELGRDVRRGRREPGAQLGRRVSGRLLQKVEEAVRRNRGGTHADQYGWISANRPALRNV